MYEKGIESIVSETACYPAKLTHGHLEDLLEMGVNKIFYPSVFYEEQQFEKADNTLNCPVVAGYSEVLKNNVEGLKNPDITVLNPFISFDDRKKLEIAKWYKNLSDEHKEFVDIIRSEAIEETDYFSSGD